MDVVVKQEAADGDALPRRASLPGPTARLPTPSSFIDLSSGSDSESDEIAALKKPRAEKAIPDDFLRLLPPDDAARRPPAAPSHRPRQFWKAGEFDAPTDSPSLPSSAGMDHVRVHPKFLHSNATSHKWALGAFAELLDNALDEVRNGATYVNVDVLVNKKDNSRMLLVEDNGGGMDPDKMRQCMSLGYSAKSKLANTIGQYGNGFKTSTMRLGADVIVFSRHCGKDGKLPTQSIGMLSYSFLTKTGKEDIVVPMLDFEKKGSFWSKMVRSSLVDWDTNLETILKWSPYLSEADLLQEFNLLTEQGTRILIYNLWDDEDGRLELDFSADRHDIQLGGVNRDERKIQMASQFPNSRHFLTYQHSLRSYSSILYRRLPSSFKIILRGKEIEHHDIVNDMMLSQEVTYRPQAAIDSFPKDPSLVAVVTIGFVKDARDHIDVQGFNVYHKNRLIKPFWRVWNASGSDGRGVIGVLEANFVEPAHDKQGFERTTVLSRLESRLVQMQKHYWSSNCHRIGYAPRRNKKAINDSHNRDSSPEDLEGQSGQYYRTDVGRNSVSPAETPKDTNRICGAGKSVQFSKAKFKGEDGHKNVQKSRKRFKTVSQHPDRTHYYSESDSEAEQIPSNNMTNGSRDFKPVCADESLSKVACRSVSPSLLPPECTNGNRMEEDDSNRRTLGIISVSDSKGCIVNVMGNEITTLCNEIINPELFMQQLKEENFELKERLKRTEESLMHDLEQEKERCKVLTEKLEETEAKLEQANREQEALIDIFSDERIRRDKEEETLRNKLKDAAMTIQELLHKLANKSGA